MNDNIKRLLAASFLAVSVASLSACNTVEGAGKDVKATGQAVENAAQDSKPEEGFQASAARTAGGALARMPRLCVAGQRA